MHFKNNFNNLGQYEYILIKNIKEIQFKHIN